MFLFFSVARSQDAGQWERAEMAQNEAATVKTVKSSAPSFAPHMPLMSSAFDTQAWLAAA
jgi:hypothetical protein